MSDETVVELHDRGWHTADALAEREDVSTRTIYRWLDRGDVEKRETEDGTRYRLAPESGESESTDTDCVSDDTPSTEGTSVGDDHDTGDHDTGDVSAFLEEIAERDARIGELEHEAGTLAGKLEAAEDENERLRCEIARLQEARRRDREELERLRKQLED
jgi:dynactin complex subunit